MGAALDTDDLCLPPYVPEPASSGRRRTTSVPSHRRPEPLYWALRPASWTLTLFTRPLDVAGDELPAVVGEWWARTVREGTVVVGDRLILGAPQITDGLWSFPGRLRRTWRRAVPVTVDVWVHARFFSRLAMTPRGPVAESRRLVSAGNAAIDRLALELAECRRTPRPDRRTSTRVCLK